jgi:hypothetical protein
LALVLWIRGEGKVIVRSITGGGSIGKEGKRKGKERWRESTRAMACNHDKR